MSIRVDLENAPSFYTNLDTIAGSVTLNLNRPEQVGSIVVKLEGEAVTRPIVRDVWGPPGSDPRQQQQNQNARRDESLATTTIASEAHKILYKIQQVFPDDYHATTASPYGSFPLQPGSHTFPFRFKVPINNLCSDQEAMMSLGQANLGNAGLFGSRGARFMDGTRQLYLRHVTQTLPPSFRNVNDEADVRYYIKVTVQRPGFLKENWRYVVHFKFMPIEPPRPPPSGQEAYARRPFTFQPIVLKQRTGSTASFLSKFKSGDAKSPIANDDKPQEAQSLEVSARLPHPPILTCNKPLPLRIITKRLAQNDEPVFLTALQVHLVGSTSARAQNNVSERSNRWVVLSAQDLNVPVTSASKPGVGDEFVVPDDVWKARALPNTIPPSFICCNITQSYSLQLTVSLRLGIAKSATAETITLPLNFSAVDVYSGVTPPPELLDAAKNKASAQTQTQARPPRLPPRQSNAGPSQSTPPQPPRPQRPPQQQQQVVQPMQPQGGTTADEFLEPPPSYSEAMAAGASSPYDGSERPPYSGVAEAEGSGPMPPDRALSARHAQPRVTSTPPPDSRALPEPITKQRHHSHSIDAQSPIQHNQAHALLSMLMTTRRSGLVAARRLFSTSHARCSSDPRIWDDFASLRTAYRTPKYPIVLAHGLFGFGELRLAASLPPIHYWHGIREALATNGSLILTPSVPPSSSISDRASSLAAQIAAVTSGPVNIIAHSMGGLDSRYLIANHLSSVRVASLTTIATPHRGSPVADLLMAPGPAHLPRLYFLLKKIGLGTEAFEQLTTTHMTKVFNETVRDDPGVRYFSYGADIGGKPSMLNTFRYSHGVVDRAEGANDGLVSVRSAHWGEYAGTLAGVSHLDLINWENRMVWAVRGWMGMRKSYNAVAFYLAIADKLAREGL